MRKTIDALKTNWFLFLAVFAGGIVLGVLFLQLLLGAQSRGYGESLHQRENLDSYTFVSPLLACDEAPFDHVSNDVLRRLEKELQAYVDSAKSSKRADAVSVYFRQLKGGPWLGIDYDREFVPASLLKVPLTMAVYKVAEKDPAFLSAEVFYESGDAAANQYFKNVAVEQGRAYTVSELVEATLVHSDNNAAELLAATLKNVELQDTYRKLGVEAPNRASDYSTNVHYYASFFRILFNATYLSAEDSEHLLETMTESTFTRGLVAGVPSGTPVSHKFGERAVGDANLVQLHDCGIVYHPQRPYLICIMTQGKDWNALSSILADISRIVWKSVD